jgi:ABC-2 type transport system ATP-binding protein
VIRIESLVKRYADRTVLAGVDLDVKRGELLALLGPNGAGKTTLIEIIEGYRRSDGGSIRVLGSDPWGAGRGFRARVGFMLQEGGVDPRVGPLEALRLYAAFYQRPREPDEVLDLVGLRSVARTRYRRLSGGEKQRLALGLALVGRPELLLLDEPTAGMDPAARRQARSLIAELRDGGTTILLTTHDLGDVERLADRVAILDRGRIVALGTPDELTGGTSPSLHLRLATPASAARLAALAGRIVIARPEASLQPAHEDDDVRFQVAGAEPDPALIALVATICAEEAIQLVELRTSSGTLEDRYLELTGDDAVEREGGASTSRVEGSAA